MTALRDEGLVVTAREAGPGPGAVLWLASAAAVAGLGGWVLVGRWRARRGAAASTEEALPEAHPVPEESPEEDPRQWAPDTPG